MVVVAPWRDLWEDSTELQHHAASKHTGNAVPRTSTLAHPVSTLSPLVARTPARGWPATL